MGWLRNIDPISFAGLISAELPEDFYLRLHFSSPVLETVYFNIP